MYFRKQPLLHSVVVLVVVTIIAAGCAATPGRVSVTKPVPALNTPDGSALKGYDAVGYFTDGKPIDGSDAFTYRWRGTNWRFASAEHRDAFALEPERFAPAFGGYCAYAVSRGTTADGDPHQWALVNGKLYVNNNAFAMQLWDRDRVDNIAAGEVNWPLIPKQPVAGEREETGPQTP
jgi:hypothetical protein